MIHMSSTIFLHPFKDVNVLYRLEIKRIFWLISSLRVVDRSLGFDPMNPPPCTLWGSISAIQEARMSYLVYSRGIPRRAAETGR